VDVMSDTKTIVDITKYIVQEDNQLSKIRDWLLTNVGPSESAGSPVCRSGEGWRIDFKSEMIDVNYTYNILVEFDRTDEAVMFKLMWP
jgi:hypothetical protein